MEKFEKLFNEFIKDYSNNFLSDKSTAYYWYKKGQEEIMKHYDNMS